jgi:hypothetical protein
MALYVKFECATCENENCYGRSLHTTEKVCDGYKHTATNADRIRAMSDEELAEWVWSAESFGGAYGPRGKNAWLNWLKSPAEVEDVCSD